MRDAITVQKEAMVRRRHSRRPDIRQHKFEEDTDPRVVADELARLAWHSGHIYEASGEGWKMQALPGQPVRVWQKDEPDKGPHAVPLPNDIDVRAWNEAMKYRVPRYRFLSASAAHLAAFLGCFAATVATGTHDLLKPATVTVTMAAVYAGAWILHGFGAHRDMARARHVEALLIQEARDNLPPGSLTSLEGFTDPAVRIFNDDDYLRPDGIMNGGSPPKGRDPRQ